MSRKFYADVLGKMCAKDANAPHTWNLNTYPWGKIVAVVEKQDGVRITVACPLTGRMAEMWLVHTILDPSREYLSQFEDEKLEAQHRAAGKGG